MARAKGERLILFLLLRAHRYTIANRLEKRRRPGKQRFTIRSGARTLLREAAHDFRGGNTGSDLIHRDEAHRPVGREDKYSGLGNAPFFERIVDIPFAHNTALRIRQNGKRQL